MSLPDPDKVPVAFWDVAACFTEKDWKLLQEGQKVFYRNVMKEIHQVLITLGFKILNAETLLRVIKCEDAICKDPENLKREADPTDPPSALQTATSPIPDVFLRIKNTDENICRESHHSEESVIIHSFRSGTVKSEQFTAAEGVGSPVGYDQSSKERENIGECGFGTQSHNSERLLQIIKCEDENCEDPENPKGAADLGDPTAENTAIDKTTDLPANPRRWDIQRKDMHPVKDDQIQAPALKSAPSAISHISDMCTEHEDSSDDPSNNTKQLSCQVRPHNCKHCNQIFAQQSQLMTHMKIHTEQKSFVLDRIPGIDCQMVLTGEEPCKSAEWRESFSQSCALKANKRFDGERTCGCTNCIISKTYLKQPQRSHTGEKPFECKVCKKSFSHASFLTVHCRMHSGERPYKCSECKKRFHSTGNLYRHERTHTGGKPFGCKECTKHFSSKSDLGKHEKIHTGVKRYECRECKKTFSCASYLTVHCRIHTGERPYRCAECDKRFNSRSHLCRHEMTHTGENPYECTECKKAFKQAYALKAHQRIHTGEKPYTCTECKKSFTQLNTLKAHQRLHTGEKPYECTECKKAFTQLASLIKHRMTHTEGKPYA